MMRDAGIRHSTKYRKFNVDDTPLVGLLDAMCLVHGDHFRPSRATKYPVSGTQSDDTWDPHSCITFD